MRKQIILLLALCLIFAAPALAAKKMEKGDLPTDAKAEKPLALALTLGDPEDSEMGLLGIAFKNYVQQESKGRMEVRLTYSGGLDADETFQFHRCQTGKLALAMGGVGNLAPMVPKLAVVTLPYIFPNVEAVVRGTTGKAAELLNSYAEKGGLRILAWTYYGYRFISNSKRPVKDMKDLKGLRIRVPQSLVMIKTYRAFGAIPVPVAWPATRSALKNDLVDGQCYDYNGFRTQKFRDVGQKYISEIHYLYNLQPLVINLKLFNSLSSEDQKILVDAGIHIQNLSLQYQKEMNAMAKKVLVEEGVHIAAISDEEPWRNVALASVWPETEDNLGGVEAINAYLAASGLPLWDPDQKPFDKPDAAAAQVKEVGKDAANPKNKSKAESEASAKAANKQ